MGVAPEYIILAQHPRTLHPMNYRWILRPAASPEIILQIQQALNNLPEALARALVLRGVDTFERARLFFRPSLTELHDPFLMAGMNAAVERLSSALTGGERIMVYGDYDVDGTTATALLVHALRMLGADVSYYVPDRFAEGYGLGLMGIDHAAASGVNLIIAVDCGVTAVEEVAHARACGIDVIVCDHHTPKPILPDAVAVLDPKRPDCTYPFKELCGCAVAFKLLQALHFHLGRPAEEALQYLDLVAIATASDIVPAHGENRVLLHFGLQALQSTNRLGILRLAAAARLDLSTCSGTGIGFGIGPRINAAGRLRNARLAVDLLLSDDDMAAAALAAELEGLNVRRRGIDQETLDCAVEMAERQLTSRTRNSIVLHHPDWHVGVIGIVASRLVERYHRPTILLGTNNGCAKGSARSIPGINVYNALQQCSHLLMEFGGHDFAAGMSLSLDNIPDFQDCFDEAVGRSINADVLRPAINVDAQVTLTELDSRFWAVLRQFAPFGPDNDPPVFQANGLRLARPPKTVGRDGKHVKFCVRQNGSGVMEAIGFGLGKHFTLLEESWRKGLPLDVLFSLEENTWNGQKNLQLKTEDLRLSEA